MASLYLSQSLLEHSTGPATFNATSNSVMEQDHRLPEPAQAARNQLGPQAVGPERPGTAARPKRFKGTTLFEQMADARARLFWWQMWLSILCGCMALLQTFCFDDSKKDHDFFGLDMTFVTEMSLVFIGMLDIVLFGALHVKTEFHHLLKSFEAAEGVIEHCRRTFENIASRALQKLREQMIPREFRDAPVGTTLRSTAIYKHDPLEGTLVDVLASRIRNVRVPVLQHPDKDVGTDRNLQNQQLPGRPRRVSDAPDQNGNFTNPLQRESFDYLALYESVREYDRRGGHESNPAVTGAIGVAFEVQLAPAAGQDQDQQGGDDAVFLLWRPMVFIYKNLVLRAEQLFWDSNIWIRISLLSLVALFCLYASFVMVAFSTAEFRADHMEPSTVVFFSHKWYFLYTIELKHFNLAPMPELEQILKYGNITSARFVAMEVCGYSDHFVKSGYAGPVPPPYCHLVQSEPDIIRWKKMIELLKRCIEYRAIWFMIIGTYLPGFFKPVHFFSNADSQLLDDIKDGRLIWFPDTDEHGFSTTSHEEGDTQPVGGWGDFLVEEGKQYFKMISYYTIIDDHGEKRVVKGLRQVIPVYGGDSRELPDIGACGTGGTLDQGGSKASLSQLWSPITWEVLAPDGELY